MPNYNLVVLCGNLTRDPETSYMTNQTAVCKFGMAVNRKWGEKEEVCFIDVVGFGKLAEVVQQYAKKGNPVLVGGRLQFQAWTDREGNKHSKHAVVLDTFQLLGGKADAGDPPKQAARKPEPELEPSAADEEAETLPEEDSIPF